MVENFSQTIFKGKATPQDGGTRAQLQGLKRAQEMQGRKAPGGSSTQKVHAMKMQMQVQPGLFKMQGLFSALQ